LSAVRRRLLALAVLLWPAAAAAQPAEPQPTVLHLTQTAERHVVRDRLRAVLRAEESGGDPLSVQRAINRKMAAALDRARAVPGIEITTGGYSVGAERPPNAPARWRGSQSLILAGADATALLKLAGALQGAGLVTSSLAYEASPEAVRGAEDDLTSEALAALDRRAAAIARTLRMSVLRFRDLRVGNAETGGQPFPRFAAMAAAGAPPVAAPGEATVSVTIQAELLLVPAPR
jgi:predicted secreted protein